MTLNRYIEINGLVFITGLEVESPTGRRGIIGPVYSDTFNIRTYVQWSNGERDKIVLMQQGYINYNTAHLLEVVSNTQPGAMKV